MLWQVRDIPMRIQNVFYEYLKTILANQPLVGVLSLLRLRGIFLEPLCHISIKIGVDELHDEVDPIFWSTDYVPCQLVSLANSCHSGDGGPLTTAGLNTHTAASDKG